MEFTSLVHCIQHHRSCRLRIFITPPLLVPRLQQPRWFFPTIGNWRFGLWSHYLHHVLEGRCFWYSLLVLIQNCSSILLPEKTTQGLGYLHINCPHGLNHFGLDLAMHHPWWCPSLRTCLRSRKPPCSLGLVVLHCCLLHSGCRQGFGLESYSLLQFVQYKKRQQ